MTSLAYLSCRCAIVFAVSIAGAGCVTEPEEIEDLDTFGDGKADSVLPRAVAIELAPGAVKRFRITTPGFVARLGQTDTVDAQLTAKHFDIKFESDVSDAPQLEARADGSVRNWSLAVFNRGDELLRATLVVDALRKTGELGIVSDIDKTILPPDVNGAHVPVYPGIASLLQTLELRNNGATGDMHFVTARTPDGLKTVPEWLAMQGVPDGSFDTGISGAPFVAQKEKVSDISRIFEARLDQTFVLFGDTSHRDPEVYKEILAKFPGRVAAVFINKVNITVNPDRVVGMHLVDNYAQAAAIAFGKDLITETEARDVMADAKALGLAITDAEIDTLIDANR